MPRLLEADAEFLTLNYDTFAPDKQAEAKDWLQRYKQQQADEGEPLFPSVVTRQVEQENNLRRMFETPDKIDYDPGYTSADPMHDKMQHANMALLSARYQKEPAEVASRYDFLINDYARQKLGASEDVDTAKFYALAQKDMQKVKLREDTQREGMSAALRGEDGVKALAAWQAKNADRAKDDAGLFMRGYQQALEQDGEMLWMVDRLLPLLESQSSKNKQLFDQTKAQELGNMIEQLAGMKKAQRKSVYRSISARIEAAGYDQKGFWSQMLGELDKGLYRAKTTLSETGGIVFDVASNFPAMLAEGMTGNRDFGMTAAETAQTDANVARRKSIGNVQQEIMQIVSGELDPVKPVTGWMNETVESGLIKGPGAVAPFMAASALLGPYGAGLVFTADFAAQNRRELVQSGLDDEQAQKIAVMAAPLQAAVESLSNMVSLGKFPAVQAALSRFTRPVGGASLVGRYVQNSLLSGVTEFTEEQMQDNVVAPVMQELLGALEKDVPEVDWSFYKTRAANATPELAATLLPMALVFGGVMTAADARLSDRMTSNVDALTALNYSQAQATEIVQEKTPEARIAKAASLWSSRAGNKATLEEGATKLAERLKALSSDAVAYQAELERRGVLPRVMHTAENDWLLTFNDGSTARFATHDEASTARWTWAEDQLGRVHALTREALTSMERNMSTNRELGVEFKPDVRMVETGQTTPDIQRRVEQGKVLGDINPNEAFDTASMVDRATAEADGFLSSYQILGSSRNEFKDGVLRTTIKLWEGSNVLTLVEEKLEGDAKAIVASRGGRGWMLTALRNYEQESGDKLFREVPDDQLTNDDLVEAWSHLGQSYLVGRSSFGEPLQQNNMRRFSRLLMRAGLAGALNSESTFWQAVVNRAQKLGELKAAGKLGEDVVAELEKQLGIDSQVKHEQGSMQEVQQVRDEVAQQVDASGYLEETPGPNGETFSLSRAVPADVSQQTVMPDGARLVGPTTFSIAEYAGKHRPNSEGPRAFDLLEGGISPADVYQHPEWYSAMEPKVIRETMAQLRKVKGNPKAKLTIYRAGPKGEMNTGDWVSLSKEYARTHAESQDPEGFKVWQAQVAADSVRWSLDDLAEFGYFGEQVAASDTGETFSIRAYHGTPHKVDKFTTAKIGTGEGAQAYGWGLYFAESKGVARNYQEQLRPRQPDDYDSAYTEAAKSFIASNGNVTLENLRAAYPNASTAALEWGMREARGQERGNLYTVELMPDADEFLDWDKPLSEQSEKVKAALSAFSPSMTGEAIYADVTRKNRAVRIERGVEIHDIALAEKQASKFLQSRKIPGIRYLDGGSRGAGDGTRNYVIFDENLVRILEENGKPVESGETFSIAPSLLSVKPPRGVVANTTDALPSWTLPKISGSVSKVLNSPKVRAEFYAKLDKAIEWLKADPSQITTAKGWVTFMRKAGVWGEIPMPPSGLADIIANPAAYVAKLNGGYHGAASLSDTQTSAKQGMDGTVEMRKLIGEGKAPAPFVVALHNMWGILSRMLSPIDQEGMWLRLIAHRPVLDAIQASIDGKFSMTVAQWNQVVQDARASSAVESGPIGNAATSNANDFYLMLSRLNGRWNDMADVYAAPNSREMGRRFWNIGAGKLGIKNKVQRFIGLTFGIPSVIMDRWKFVEFWLPTAMEGMQANEPSSYFNYSANTPSDPVGVYGVYGGIDSENEALSLAMYEAFEVVLEESIAKSQELQNHLGEHANAGGMHWFGWNAIKNEAVGHSSLDLTKELIATFGLDIDAEKVHTTVTNGTYYTEGSPSAGNTVKFVLERGKVRVERTTLAGGLQSGQAGRNAKTAGRGIAEGRTGTFEAIGDTFSLRVTPAQDAEYLAAVEAGDMEKAQRMVMDAAKRSGLPILSEEGVTAYRARRVAPPRKTVKAYKLFRVKKSKPGEVFALFVGADDPLPRGVWLDAISGPKAEDSKTGKAKVKSKLGPLAFRPGWHAGDIPLATHIGAKNKLGEVFARKDDEVWAEVEMADDDQRWKAIAQANGTQPDGSFSGAKADVKEMPVNGMYRYKTNPNMTGQWIISGSMRINRILSEQEVNDILSRKGVQTMPWASQAKGGKVWEVGQLDLDKWNLGTDPARNQKKLLDPITYDDNGNVIPLSQRFNPADDRITYSLRPGDFASRVEAMFSPFQRSPEARLVMARVAKDRALRLGNELIEKANVIRTMGSIDREARVRAALAEDKAIQDYLDGLTPAARQTLEWQPADLQDDPLVAAMLDFGKLMSKTTALQRGKLDLKMGDFDGAPWLPPSFYSKGAGIMPDQMAQAMFDAGLLPDAYTDTLWAELSKRIEATRKDKAAHREAVQAFKDAKKAARDAASKEADKWADNAKKQAGSGKAQRDRIKAWLRVLDGILAASPPEVRARVGGFVKMAGIATDEAALRYLEDRVAKLDKELEKWLKKDATGNINRLFKKAAADYTAGKKAKGKLGPDEHYLFQRAEAASEMDAAALRGELAKLDALSVDDSLSDDQRVLAVLERGIVELVGDMKNADSGRLFTALDELTRLYSQGVIAWKTKQIARREARQAVRDALKADAGKSGVLKERQAMEKAMTTLFGKAKSAWLSVSSFSEVLRYAFGSKSQQATELIDGEREASNAYEDEQQAIADELEALFTSMAGGKVLDGERLRFDMAQRTIKAGDVELSQFEAITALLMWRQEDGRRHMEGTFDENGQRTSGWSYDQAWIDEVEKQLTPEGRRVMAWLAAKYGSEHGELNALYRERHGVNLPAHDNYAPLTVKPMQAKAGEIVDPVSGAAVSGSILTPGSLRTRSRMAIAEPEFRDALQTFVAHKKQMGYWKAYYDLATDVQAVLGNRELMNSVEAAAGKEAVVTLRKWMDVLAQGGVRDAAAGLAMNSMFQRMMSRAATVGLLGRVSTLLVQSTQLAAASVQMPVGAYLRRFGKLLAGQLDWKGAIQSDFIQRRMQSAPPIVRQAMENLGTATRPNLIKQAVRKLGNLLTGADGLFTGGTYAILLDYHRETGRKLGLTGTDLEEHAHREAERATEEVAQPTRTATRSLAEITATNPLAKVSFAYASEARQKIALLGWSAVNFKADPVRFGKAAFLVFGVGGVMSQVLKNIWKEIKGDDDEEKWSPERLIKGSFVNALHGIPMMSEIMGEPGMFSSAAWAKASLNDLLEGKADLRDINTLLGTLGLFNDTTAGVAALSNAGYDFAKIIEAAFSDASNK